MYSTDSKSANFCRFATLLFILLSACKAHSQGVPNQLNTGYPENSIFHGTEIENVQFQNGNLHVDIPIWSAKGRGLNTGFNFVYDNHGFTFRTQCFTSGGGFCQDTVIVDPLSQIMLTGFGPLDYKFATLSGTSIICSGVAVAPLGNFFLREPDGTKHHFSPDPVAVNSSACTGNPMQNTLYADDGSGWIMQIDRANGVILSATNQKGTTVINSVTGTPLTLKDSNGNQLASNGATALDTLGRTIPTNGSYYDSSGILQSPTVTSSGGLITQIVLPNNQGTYSFTYAPIMPTQICQFSNADTCIESNNGGGEIASITLPTGGQISYTWGQWDRGGRKIATRAVNANGVPEPWSYQYATDFSTTVTDPAHKDMKWTTPVTTATNGCKGLYGEVVQYFDGVAGASPVLKTVQTDFDSTLAKIWNNCIPLPTRLTTTWNQQNLVSKVETDWDLKSVASLETATWKNPTERREYDWGSGAPGALLRRTDYSYRHLEADGQSYLNANIADLPSLVQMFDGGGTLLAKTQNSYDGSGLINTNTGTCQSPSVPGHDYCTYGTGNLVRGNVTQTSRWLNTSNTWFSTNNTYDDLGNLLTTSDPGGHTTTFDYTDTWGGTGCVTAGSTYAFPTTITNAKGQRTRASYYPCTSLVQSKKDENDIVAGRSGTTTTYDLMNRPLVTQKLDAGGQILAKTSRSYNDTVLPLSITKTVTAAPSPDVISTVIVDGLGRTSQAVQNDPEGNVTSEVTYDALGRQSSVTNPHRSVAAATDGATQYVYDTLGRTTDVTKPDSNTVHTDYAGNSVTVSDETLRQRRSVSDGLGRLIEADEPGDAYQGVQARGSIDIGPIKTAQVGGHSATTANGSVTISGSELSKTTSTRYCAAFDNHGRCVDWEFQTDTIYDAGTVKATVNGHTDQTTYGQGDNVGTIANRLAGVIRTNSPYVDYTTVSVNLSATPPTATINLVSRTASSASNYPLSATYTYDTVDFTAGSFTTSTSGAALTGGSDAFGGTPVTDHGTVTMTAGPFTTPSIPYGPGTANLTAGSVATALASALSAGGSGVSASTNGGTLITVTESAFGVSGNGIAISTHPTSADPTDFPSPSFAVNSTSLSGGVDPYPSGLAHPYLTLYSYDGLDNLICVEQHGNATGTGCSAAPASDATSPWRVRRFTYDSLSRLLTAKYPEAGQTNYQYDIDSNLTSKTDARGVTVNYSPSASPIDVLHRITQKTYSDGTPSVTYQYDTGCCGVTPENPAGRMTAAFSGNTELVFSYDPMGRIKTQWDCPPSGIARGFCYVISAAYDDIGNVTSLTYPDNRVVTSAYNAAGRFLRTDLVSFGGTAVNFNYYTVPQSTSAANWGYSPTGAMNRGTYGNGVIETTGYNNRLQVSSIADAKNGTALFSKTYAYSDASGHNNGNILSIADTLSATRNQTYTYDSLNRILTGAQADNIFNLTYSYDAWGNMRESGTSIFQPLFDVNNRMTPSGGCTPNLVSYCYDAAGDLLMDNHNHVYAYDGEARIKTVDGNGAAYTYNPLGNRVRKDIGSTSTEYFFFGGGVIAELNPTTGAWTDYIGYGKRIAKDTSNNGTGAQYYHGDHLGSARIMTDSTAVKISDCTFNPFGEQVICSPDNASNHYRFTGKEHDNESGLDLMGARYYGNAFGRFVQADPLYLEFHRLTDPQQLNLYTYGRNNPLEFTDPLGLDITCDGTRCENYVGALQRNVSFKLTMDKNGKIGTEGDIDKKHLSKSEKEILKAIGDDKHHVTIHAIDGGKDASVTFGRSDGNHTGSHTIAFDQAALLDSAKNAGGMTSAQLVGHETLEGYAESQGNSLQDAHNYANWYFGGFESGGKVESYGAQGGMVVQITGILSVHGSSTAERITSQFATPIPQADFLRGKGAPYPQYPIKVEAVENKK